MSATRPEAGDDSNSSSSSNSGATKEVAGSKKPAAKECFGFESQTWRKNVCKNCFRMKSQHTTGAQAQQQQQQHQQQQSSQNPGGAGESPPSSSVRKLAASGSPRASRKGGLERTGSGKSHSSSPSGSRRTTPESKRKDYKEETASKLAANRSRSASKESARSSSRGHAVGSGFDEKYVEDLENDLFDMEDKYDTMCREKAQLETQMEERLGDIEDLEGELDSCRAKISTLEKRVAQLEQEIRGYRERLKLPESEQGHSDVASEAGDSRAQELEDLCQELMEENDQLKEEVEELQKELSEMHDSFHEEDSQANTVRELQRELDAANKSYRVIQFKLRKAERRFDQCEAERSELEEKFRRLGERMLSGDENVQIQELEDELRMAKEVSVRLHDELEFIEEKRVRLEGENQKLKFELESSERDRIRLENEIDRAKLELNKVKSDAGLADSGPLQVVDKSSPRPRLGQVVSRESSIEEDHLKRELTATRERETDLVEQLRYSKEEVKILKRKLEEAEEENDSLTSKLRKIATGGEGGRVRFSSDDSADVDLDDSARPRTDDKELAALRGRAADTDAVGPTVDTVPTDADAVTDAVADAAAAAAADAAGRRSVFKYNTSEAQALLTEIDSEMNEMRRKVQAAAQFNCEDFALQEKWIEASEAKKQLELKVTELRRRIGELEDANLGLKVAVERLDGQRGKSGGKKTVQELENASKAELLREIGDLEDEVEDLLLVIKKGDFKVENLEYRLKALDEDLQETRRAYEEDERFFIEQVEKLQKQNELLGDLLALVTLRRRFMYEFESSITSSGSDAPKAAATAETKADADEVFTDSQPEQDVHYWDNKFRERLHSLELLLKEERQRTRQYQKRLESLSEDQKREEKDNEKYKIIVEDKEAQLKDCQSKLEQSRKMYEALKLLVDDSDSQSASTAQSRIEDRTKALQINKQEMAELKKKNEQLTARVTKMEKDKAAGDKSSHILNEELKLREEHIFEQDDMIRGLQRKLQEADREFERLKSELYQLKSQFSSVKEKNTESARLKEELQKYISANSDKERQLAELNDQLTEKKAELSSAEERLRNSQEAVRNRDDRIKEKDELISLINTRLANREREIADLDSVLKQTNQKLATAEGDLSGARQQASEHEKEARGLRCRLDELQASCERHSAELQQLRQRCEQLTQTADAAKDESARKCDELRRERDHAREQLEMFRGHGAVQGHNDSVVDGSLPMDVQVRLKHLEQVEKIYLQLTHQQVTLKMQVDAYQREVEEFRELFYSTNERYKNERGDWMQQKESLQKALHQSKQPQPPAHELQAELLQKEKSLLQLQERLEAQARQHDEETTKLQRQNLELKSKANAFVEEKKVPKVLQRFAGSKKSPMVGSDGAFDAERTEYQVRLAEQEKKMDKLRKEVRDLAEKLAERSLEKLDRWGREVVLLSQRVDSMQMAADQADGYRSEAEQWRSRADSLQEALIKERKRWQGEKLGLQYSGEQFRVMLDQWLDRFINAIEEMDAMRLEAAADATSGRQEELRATIQLIVADIGKYKSRIGARERSPSRQQQQQQQQQQPGRIPGGFRSALSSASEEPGGAGQTASANQKPAAAFGAGLSSRSISMDWSPAKSFLRSESPFRSKRSASPDVSQKKAPSHFPEPGPGFWIKPSSRTNSKESLGGSQSNLTFVRFSPQAGDDAGQPASRSANAAARRRFYEAYDEKVYSSSERLHRRPGADVSLSADMSLSAHEDAAPTAAAAASAGGDAGDDPLGQKSHSLDLRAAEKPPPAKPKSKNPFGVTLKSVKADRASPSGKVAAIKKLFPR